MAEQIQTSADTKYTRVLGNLAYARGMGCVPAQDTELMKMFDGRRVGDSRTIPEMKAWIAGWLECHAADVAPAVTALFSGVRS